MKTLPRALRWTLIGVLLSILSNDMFEGAFVPATVVLALPAWVIVVRENIGVGIDFLSPVSGWLVARFGGFTSLAGAELTEGVLILLAGVWFFLGSPTPMLLLVLACLLLATGQIIDVASEVFESDAAGEDDDALVRYSGLIDLSSTLVGALLGRYLGSVLAIVDIPLMLVASGVLSLAAAATRLVVGRQLSNSDETEEEYSAPLTSTARSQLSRAHWFSLLLCSFLLGAVPAYWAPYTVRSWGQTRGEAMMSNAYLASGIGAVLAATVFLYFARRLGMRRLARYCLAVAVLGLLLLPFVAPLAVVGFGLAGGATSAFAQTVVTSRQLLARGATLARLTGQARLAFAAGASLGSLGGWLVLDYVGVQALPLGAVGMLLPAFWASRVLPATRTIPQ